MLVKNMVSNFVFYCCRDNALLIFNFSKFQPKDKYYVALLELADMGAKTNFRVLAIESDSFNTESYNKTAVNNIIIQFYYYNIILVIYS